MRYLLVSFCLLISLAGFAQNAKIDSLKKVIETTKVDTVKGRSLCKLCVEYAMLGEMEIALNKGEKGLNILKPTNDVNGSGMCMNNLGNIHYIQGNYPQAISYYEKSMKNYVQVGNQSGVGNCLMNLGIIYKNQGNYPKALEFYQKSLDLYEKTKFQKYYASCLLNIGTIYFDLMQDDKAFDYFQKSIKIYEKLQDSLSIVNCYNYIGNIYHKSPTFSKALEYYQKSLAIYEQKSFKSGIVRCLGYIGDVYFEQGDHTKALNYYQRNLKISEGINEYTGILSSNVNMGKTYLKMQNPNIAKIYANKALTLARDINHLVYIKLAVTTLYQADSALGDYKSAFEHHKLYKQYSDSLHNEDKAKEFGRVESKYQFEKEAEEAKRKQEELAKIEAEKTERRDNLQYLTIFAGIIGLFAGLVFIGKFRIPTRVMDVAVFAGLLITFEFLLILFDPYFDQYSGGIPFYKLGFNTVVAFAFAPLHGFLEGKLKKRLVKAEKA